MINKKYIKLIRTRKRFNSSNFINDIISKRIIDCIDLLKVNFSEVLEMGISDELIHNYLIKKYTLNNLTRSDLYDFNKKNNTKNSFIRLELDDIKLNNNSYDLIFSNNFLHLFNDFHKIMFEVSNSLKSNGFFIAAVPEINNIIQLKESMYNTDLNLYNGVYQRFSATIEVDQVLSILKKLNFDVPTVIIDKLVIEYNNFDKLLNDVRATNTPYANIDKKNNFENKYYFKLLREEYKKKFFKNYYPLEIRFNLISAWKK